MFFLVFWGCLFQGLRFTCNLGKAKSYLQQLLLSCGARWHLKPIEASEILTWSGLKSHMHRWKLGHVFKLMEFAISTPTLLPLLEHPRMIIAATQIPLDTMQQQIGLIYLKQLDISEIFRQNRWTPIRPFQSSITNTLPPSWSHPSTKARWSIPSKPPSFETCETVSTLGHLPAITGRGPSLSSGHGSNQVLRWDFPHPNSGQKNDIKFW